MEEKINSVDVNGFEGHFFFLLLPERNGKTEGFEQVSKSDVYLKTTIRKNDFKKLKPQDGEFQFKDKEKLNKDTKLVVNSKPIGVNNTSAVTFRDLPFQKNFKDDDFKSFDSVPDKQYGNKSSDGDEKPDYEKNKLGKCLRETGHFTCKNCGKKCNTPGNLRVHMETHQDNLRYRCEQCEKSFKQKAGLIQHMNVHFAKMYSCGLCFKKFANAANLSRHKKKHLKEPGVDMKVLLQNNIVRKREKKRHKCSICQKVMSRKCLLTEHMNVHNNLRPYQCDQCPLAFAGKANFFKHKKLHRR